MRMLRYAFVAGCLPLFVSACDVDQTQEGEAPEIDVQAEAGELPEYDVQPADVDVSTGTEEVEVPTLDVDVGTPDAEGTPVTAAEE